MVYFFAALVYADFNENLLACFSFLRNLLRTAVAYGVLLAGVGRGNQYETGSYGDDTGTLGLRPCMRLVTRITTIKHLDAGTDVSYGRRFTTDRTTRMAVLGVGYADGLPRLCSNKCSFAAAGGLAPQRGSICMDMCMADVSDLPEAAVDGEVEIFGPLCSLETLAAAAQTIPYELLCAVTKRVPRVYLSK